MFVRPEPKKEILKRELIKKNYLFDVLPYTKEICVSFLMGIIIVSLMVLRISIKELAKIDGDMSRNHCDSTLIGPESKTCHQLNKMMGEKTSFAMYPLAIFVGAFVLAIGLAFKIAQKVRKSKPHPHHQITSDFFKKNPDYPENSSNSTEIECPLLLGKVGSGTGA